MTYAFLYPCDPFDNKKIESTFEEEYNTIKENFNVYLIDVDNLESSKNYKNIGSEQLIYRGWMLKPNDYELLEKKLEGKLKISTIEYLSHHYLPNWYESIKNVTPESIISTEENVGKDFLKSGWNKAFIKDYVKSLKTGKGSIVDSEEDINRAIIDMKQYRGFIEGGIILRKVYSFNPEKEKRFFILNNKIHSPSSEISEEELSLLTTVMNSQKNSFFYSIDLSEDENNKKWVIEIGDGQVSDCVGWNPDEFGHIFNSLKPQIKKKL